MPDAGGYVGTLAVQPDGAMNMIHMLYSLILMTIQKVLQAIFDDPEEIYSDLIQIVYFKRVKARVPLWASSILVKSTLVADTRSFRIFTQ